MRIIHTADWHIGNNFYDHDRSAEHRDFLDFLLRAIHDHEADALVIAGDVFDNPNPSAAAQKLYYDFLGKASEQNPGLQIVVTAGNHDSGMRLEAARTLLEGRKIYIRGFLHTEEGDSAMLDDLLIPLHSRRNPDDEVICIAVPFLRSSDLPVEDSFSRSMGRFFSNIISEARHRYGAKSSEARRAVEETDEMLGMLFSAAQETGDAEQTDFVLVSDHGQRDIRRVFCPNVLLRQEGLIRGGPDGRQADWDAYCHTEGMFATVHLKDPGDAALRRRVEALLRGLPEERTGIARVADAAELVTAPAQAGFAFALLSDGETAFGSGTTGALLREDIPGGQRATHGYPPDIGPDPVFLGAGPGFARDAVTEEMNLEDVAPTLAAVLGTKLPEAQGIVRRELLA